MIIAGVVTWLCAGDGTREVVATRARVAGRPEHDLGIASCFTRTCRALRLSLPAPVHTDGDIRRPALQLQHRRAMSAAFRSCQKILVYGGSGSVTRPPG